MKLIPFDLSKVKPDYSNVTTRFNFHRRVKWIYHTDEDKDLQVDKLYLYVAVLHLKTGRFSFYPVDENGKALAKDKSQYDLFLIED